MFVMKISSTNVPGTFSGVLLSDEDGTTTQSVTNDKFDVAVTATKQQ
jgi:hypothetical protein